MKIILSAGGTAGHINPALATAGEIKKRYPDAEILFVGTANKMEAKLVPQAGYDFASVDISGFYRSFDFESIIHNIKTLMKLLRSSGQAKKIIKKFKPDVCVGFGGYASAPVLNAAAKQGIPCAIHEQNAFPGVTNKMLAKKVDCVMLTSENAEKHLEPKNKPVVTGLPVRGEMLEADAEESRAKLGVSKDAVLVLSMGGSLGAEAINRSMVSLIKKYAKDQKFHFIHSMGSKGLWVKDELKDEQNYDNVELREYISDMDVCMSAADIVICRAGASSLSEIQALGKPSILIPSPNVAENHQYHNAMALVEKGAAEVIEEKDLSDEKLEEVFESMIKDSQTLAQYADNAKAMAILDAKEKIADIVISLIKV